MLRAIPTIGAGALIADSGHDLAYFLEHSGAVAGGGAAFGATIGFVAASMIHTFSLADYRADWAMKGGGLGGLFGICVLAFEALGVK